jgi:four helix bundle protein
MKSKYHFRFEDLKIYQKAVLFGELANKLISKFPKYEDFKLSSQFAKAADSIALNIAEGYSDSDANFNRYLIISQGSINECVSCATKAKLRNYISKEENEEVRKELSELSRMNTSLRKKLISNS